MIDRKDFFDAVRLKPFGGALTQQQVDGMESLLDEWESLKLSSDLRFLAYILAGVYHETGGRMVPVREAFAKTDAGAMAAVTKLYNQRKIKVNYSIPVNGISYFGRGRIQNTWYENYVKLEKRFGLPFVKQPSLLLDDKIDAKVTIIGHIEGIWTGKKLSDYFTPTKSDPINARRIVNGTDKAALITGYYAQFLDALEEAYVPEPEPEIPAPVGPDPVVPVDPVIEPVPSAAPARSGPLWDAYVALALHFGDEKPEENKVILKSIIVSTVADVVTDAVIKAARKATNPLPENIAPEVAADVVLEASRDPRLQQLQASIEHQTNNEPIYKSRVSIGAIIAGFSGLLGAFGIAVSPESQEQIVATATAAGTIIGAAVTLYGRWKARTPLFER